MKDQAKKRFGLLGLYAIGGITSLFGFGHLFAEQRVALGIAVAFLGLLLLPPVRGRTAWLILVALALIAVLTTTRYDVVSFPSGVKGGETPGGQRSTLTHDGCYVLDRWTGRVEFQVARG